MGVYVAAEIAAERERMLREGAPAASVDYLDHIAVAHRAALRRAVERPPAIGASAGFWARLHEAMDYDD